MSISTSSALRSRAAVVALLGSLLGGVGAPVSGASLTASASLAAGASLAVLLPEAARADTPLKLAILPIVVHSADDRGYLRAGLADMLSARLEQVGHFEVMRIDEDEVATTRLLPALRTARDAGADFVLFGSFTRFGSGASLDMQCAATSQADDEEAGLREIFVYSGSIGEVIPDLDELVGKISRFAVAGFGNGPGNVAAGPPGSDDVASLRARLEALEALVQELQAKLTPASP